MTKSCFNCRHLLTWHSPATRHEPEDSGWECGNPDLHDLSGVDEADFTSDDAAAEAYAKGCCGYDFFDHEEQQRKQAAAVAEYERQMRESEPKPEDLVRFNAIAYE